ncbi:hypothetical protein NNO_1121 [Hydrogenimonas sp.]|nr:hypothetical protein NNO_1121 [Hydrogenimonas sp.]
MIEEISSKRNLEDSYIYEAPCLRKISSKSSMKRIVFASPSFWKRTYLSMLLC